MKYEIRCCINAAKKVKDQVDLLVAIVDIHLSLITHHSSLINHQTTSSHSDEKYRSGKKLDLDLELLKEPSWERDNTIKIKPNKQAIPHSLPMRW
jgi:hypothetical protein